MKRVMLGRSDRDTRKKPCQQGKCKVLLGCWDCGDDKLASKRFATSILGNESIAWHRNKEIMMQEINETCYVVFHLRRNTTNFHVKTEDGQKNNHGDLDETVKPVTTFTATYNFRKVDCDPLRKIKRRIGYILFEEFCATSDEQLLVGL